MRPAKNTLKRSTPRLLADNSLHWLYIYNNGLTQDAWFLTAVVYQRKILPDVEPQMKQKKNRRNCNKPRSKVGWL